MLYAGKACNNQNQNMICKIQSKCYMQAKLEQNLDELEDSVERERKVRGKSDHDDYDD